MILQAARRCAFRFGSAGHGVAVVVFPSADSITCSARDSFARNVSSGAVSVVSCPPAEPAVPLLDPPLGSQEGSGCGLEPQYLAAGPARTCRQRCLRSHQTATAEEVCPHGVRSVYLSRKSRRGNRVFRMALDCANYCRSPIMTMRAAKRLGLTILPVKDRAIEPVGGVEVPVPGAVSFVAHTWIMCRGDRSQRYRAPITALIIDAPWTCCCRARLRMASRRCSAAST